MAVEHLVLPAPGGPLRLDISDELAREGQVAIVPLVDLGRNFRWQLDSIRRLRALLSGGSIRISDSRLARLAMALRAIDALAAGASLRDIGLVVIGGKDWPGDGEHLKSRARRLVTLAGKLRRAGAAGVLARTV